MDRDFLNESLLFRPTLLVDLDSFQFGERHKAVIANELPEHCVQPIQMGSLVEQDEKLRAVGGRAFVRHGNDATHVVLQGLADFILEGSPPDALASLWILRGRLARTPSLDHEVWDQPVEGGLVIVSRCAKRQEILDCYQ